MEHGARPARLPGAALLRLLATGRRADPAGVEAPDAPHPAPPPQLRPDPPRLTPAVPATRAAAPAVPAEHRDQPPRARSRINATGTVFAADVEALPLAEEAVDAVAQACRSGHRSDDAIERAIMRLTGAEAALVVADQPAALTLVLAALAGPRADVVIARADLRELPGGLRIEQLIRASGARPVETGAVNAPTAADMRAATTPSTRVILTLGGRGQDGTPSGPRIAELAPIARLQGAMLVHGFGGGALGDDTIEASIGTMLADGADLVVAPGDRLIGGPACGIVAGTADAMAPVLRLATATRAPCERIVRAALDATLGLHAAGPDGTRPARRRIGLFALMSQDRLLLEERARRLAGLLDGFDVRVVPTEAVLGGGIATHAPIPSAAVSIGVVRPHTVPDILEALRRGDPSIAAGAAGGRLRIDLFAVRDDALGAVAGAIRASLAPPPPQDLDVSRGLRSAEPGREARLQQTEERLASLHRQR